MYVCMHACVYVCMYVCTVCMYVQGSFTDHFCVCINVCMYVCMNMCMCVCMCIYTFTGNDSFLQRNLSEGDVCGGRRWLMYGASSDLTRLLRWLNDKGVREAALKKQVYIIECVSICMQVCMCMWALCVGGGIHGEVRSADRHGRRGGHRRRRGR